MTNKHATRLTLSYKIVSKQCLVYTSMSYRSLRPCFTCFPSLLWACAVLSIAVKKSKGHTTVFGIDFHTRQRARRIALQQPVAVFPFHACRSTATDLDRPVHLDLCLVLKSMPKQSCLGMCFQKFLRNCTSTCCGAQGYVLVLTFWS